LSRAFKLQPPKWRVLEVVAMRRTFAIGALLGAALSVSATGVALATWAGPASPAGHRPGITGNDTGGIIPYAPELDGAYDQIAQDYCARWHRLSQITSMHRVYGDYVSFVCIDKPWMIH
jgi:hypothetical protein